MLNQNISTTVQHPHHNSNGTDLGMNGDYVQQQRQQQLQMSGSYQRPSNGSNILEPHAMRPATTADPSNCVFNDQDSSVCGILQNDSPQMRQPNMMSLQTHSMQQNQMVSNNMMTTGNATRLPSLTLNNSNFNVSSSMRNQQSGQNEFQNQQSFQQNMHHSESAQQPQQMNQRPYDQSSCQTKLPSMTMNEQQLFGQQSMNSQQMVTPPRMNTPVLNHQQNIQPQNVQQQNMQSIQQQNNLQTNIPQSNLQQHNNQRQNVQHQQVHQQQNRMQSGMNQQQQQSQNVHHHNTQQPSLHHQDQMVRQQVQHNVQQQQQQQMVQQPHRCQQESIQGMQTQNVRKPVMQQQNMQQSGMQQQPNFQQRSISQSSVQQQSSMQQQQNFQQQNVQQSTNQQHLTGQTQSNSQQQQQHAVYQQNADLIQMNSQQPVFMQQKTNGHHNSMCQSQVQNGNRIVSSFQQNPTSDQMTHLSHMSPTPTEHSINSVPQSQLQKHSIQVNANSTQMISVQNQMQSPTDISFTSSSVSTSKIPLLTFGNSTPHTISQSNIPMNANSTTQILMALNSNSPISAEQLSEIQKMTCTGPDGSQILLMQEPRLKQYSSLKEMSTHDLRSECKKRSLASTGTKVRLSERLAEYETEVLDERNQQLMMEYTHRKQMYEAQAATLKAFQAKKASLQVQSNQSLSISGPVVSSNEISSTTQSTPISTQQAEGPPPAKKRRATKSKKSQQQQQQQQEKQKVQSKATTSSTEQITVIGTVDNGIMNMLGSNNQSLGIGNIRSIGTNGNNQSNSSIGSHGNQTTSSNIFGNVNQPGSGFFMKDNTCFSHLGSGCRLISANSEDGQNSSYSGTGRAFPLPVPPPPEDTPLHFQSIERQTFGISEPLSQTQLNVQSCPLNLNQQQSLGTNNVSNAQCEPVNTHISNMFNPSPMNNGQQQNQQQAQPQSQQNFMNSVQQNVLQSSPCAADQAGSSPNMPVNDTLATTSSSPVLVNSVSESSYTSEIMDIETMQQLLSPETLRAREELLTQQQAKINELVKLIQKHHDTLREQQLQINLAKRQQKMRQRQSTQPTCALDKHVNSRSLEHVIKSRQNFQVLNELTKQQDSIRTAETRLIEQLHINNATDDIARLIKQDGRTALVIVSLLHHYRTTREQNNQPKSTDDSAVPDKTTESTKKKAAPRKRNNNGNKVAGQNKKISLQQQPDIEVVQVISPRNEKPLEEAQQKLQPEVLNSETAQQSTSDINMDAIFEIVINPSDGPKNRKPAESQVTTLHHFDNEVISLPSEGSSPTQMQTLNSAQSGLSDGFNSKNIVYQENSPQQTTFINTTDSRNSSTFSPENMLDTRNDAVQHHFSVNKQLEVMDALPQLEHQSIEQELGNHQFTDTFHFSDDSNQGFFDQNCQNNFDQNSIYSETAFDQLVADFRTNPPNCEEDGDLNKILNSFDNFDNARSRNNKDIRQEADELCDLFDQGNSLGLEQFQSFDWNEFNAQSNIINQAFEQSEMH